MRAQTEHLPAAVRSRSELTALPESFGQLTALQTLDLSQRSACMAAYCILVCGRMNRASGAGG